MLHIACVPPLFVKWRRGNRTLLFLNLVKAVRQRKGQAYDEIWRPTVVVRLGVGRYLVRRLVLYQRVLAHIL